MAGRTRRSILKQKAAKYYKERENPIVTFALQDEIIRLNRKKLIDLLENIDYLKQVESSRQPEKPAVRFILKRFPKEPVETFIKVALYEALRPIVVEYRYMPLQAILVWYLKVLEMIYGERIPAVHLNRLRKWIRFWLSCTTPEQELQLKSSIVSWILSKS